MSGVHMTSRLFYCSSVLVSVLTLLHAFTGENQVTTFLNHNGGPGVQHVALHTDNIIDAVSSLRSNGVQFIKPPPEYYSLVCC